MDKSQGLKWNQWLGKLEQTYQVLVKLVGGKIIKAKVDGKNTKTIENMTNMYTYI